MYQCMKITVSLQIFSQQAEQSINLEPIAENLSTSMGPQE